MLSCREVCEQAQDFSDGRLGPLARARIRLHLLMCRNCTSFVDQTRQTGKLIRSTLSRQQGSKVSPELMAAFRRKTGRNSTD